MSNYAVFPERGENAISVSQFLIQTFGTPMPMHRCNVDVMLKVELIHQP